MQRLQEEGPGERRRGHVGFVQSPPSLSGGRVVPGETELLNKSRSGLCRHLDGGGQGPRRCLARLNASEDSVAT